jgi:hypothetical protein
VGSGVSERTAYHEAGHTVLVWAFGFPLIGVSVFGDGDAGGGVLTVLPADEVGTLRERDFYLTLSHGGWAAEGIRFRSCYRAGCKADMNHAKKYHDVRAVPDRQWESDLSETALLACACLAECWPAVQAIARALRKHYALYGDQARAIIEAALQKQAA